MLTAKDLSSRRFMPHAASARQMNGHRQQHHNLSSTSSEDNLTPQLPLPDSMQHIWIITGPAGSGKTTVAKALAKELSLPYIEGDDVGVPSCAAFCPVLPIPVIIISFFYPAGFFLFGALCNKEGRN
jgi:Cdc6-like AAA superfamily ATPase